MDKLTFDYQVVDIDLVVPNTWNPKKDNPERYAEVVNSVKEYGLTQAVTVREKGDKFEIIDGFHRHKACKELGYTKVIINNQGVMDDATAKRLTIVFQKVQVPFNEVMYSELLKSLTDELSEEEVLRSLPIKEPELEGYLNMSEFDFEKEYADIEISDKERENVRGMTIILNEDQADIARKAIDEVRRQADQDDLSPARAIELICADYMAGSIPNDKPEDLNNG